MIEVTIDGKQYEFNPGTTVLQACRQAGIAIPTLCDHPAVKPYGGCRLCVVEVDGMRTLQASCTLPVFNKMVVQTGTARVRAAREFILTLLFSERNHFCMYCQSSGGDCELQNAAYAEGMTHWPLQPNWKPFELDGSHPYISLDNNRCILCRRCVRACSELVGNATLGIENRGARSMLVADAGLPLGESSCVSCGTCIQVCPTGALIDRSSAYYGLSHDAERVSSVCIGCSVGCGIEMVVRDGRLIRVEGDWESAPTHGLLCQTGRFESLENGRQRIASPFIRQDGELVPATWDQALDLLAQHIQGLESSKELAALVSTRLPAEALYGFKSLFGDRLNSPLVTGIEEDLTASAGQYLGQDTALQALDGADCVLVVGADLVRSHQVAGFLVKRGLPQGTTLIVVDPHDNQLGELAHYHLRPSAGTDAALLQGLMSSLKRLGLDRGQAPASLLGPDEAAEICGVPAEKLASVAHYLGVAERPVIVYGKGLTQPSALAALDSLHDLAGMLSAETLNLRGKANSLAAECFGLTRAFQPQGCQAAYLALGDDYPTGRLVDDLAEVPFLAVQASYVSPLTERADVVLPVEIWSEQEGAYLNMEGRLQWANAGVPAPEGVRSNLAALQDLAAELGLKVDENWQDAILSALPGAAIPQPVG